ncbi:hypothetical protein EVAR_80923_1 [Eumeta japonica]|uniref:Uncharacterized protein n=1 Tax=Eumeta variegata TaxID=151549 RepID=A0A4C1V1H4_EUMVA|nr:hypothetical protein EVAR_80923_1 [Eumeta japonica]
MNLHDPKISRGWRHLLHLHEKIRTLSYIGEDGAGRRLILNTTDGPHRGRAAAEGPTFTSTQTIPLDGGTKR